MIASNLSSVFLITPWANVPVLWRQGTSSVMGQWRRWFDRRSTVPTITSSSPNQRLMLNIGTSSPSSDRSVNAETFLERYDKFPAKIRFPFDILNYQNIKRLDVTSSRMYQKKMYHILLSSWHLYVEVSLTWLYDISSFCVIDLPW